MQRLGRRAAAGVQVNGFLPLVRVEDEVKVAVGKDDPSPEEGVGPVSRDALEAVDQGLVDEGDAERLLILFGEWGWGWGWGWGVGVGGRKKKKKKKKKR